MRGNDFNFFQYQQGNIRIRRSKRTLKSTFLANITPVVVTNVGQISRFLDFLKVLDLFRKCLGIIFGLQRLTFGNIFRSKGC